MTIRELESLMQKHNLNKSQLADIMGVHRSSVSRILSVEKEDEKDNELEGWANAALTQYFTNLDLKERLDSLYPIRKKLE